MLSFINGISMMDAINWIITIVKYNLFTILLFPKKIYFQKLEKYNHNFKNKFTTIYLVICY